MRNTKYICEAKSIVSFDFLHMLSINVNAEKNKPIRIGVSLFNNRKLPFYFLKFLFHSLDGLVDAYILLESNYSSYGTQKPLR
jgi:hypothetical protein